MAGRILERRLKHIETLTEGPHQSSHPEQTRPGVLVKPRPLDPALSAASELPPKWGVLGGMDERWTSLPKSALCKFLLPALALCLPETGDHV